jgi:nitroreductase
MDIMDTILTRRSIRKFMPDPLSDDLIKQLIKAGMHAPSAVNKQPWEFLVFRDKKSMRAIVNIHPNAAMLLDANIGLLVCWDENRQHDVGYGPVDCAAATQNILLAAHGMGIGAVWVGLYPRQARMDAVQKIFSLPEHIKGFAVIALGYPAEQKTMPQRFDPQKIHYETW